MSSDGPEAVYDIEFRAVTKRFGDLTAVNAVSLQVHQGEFPGIAALNQGMQARN